MNQKYCTSLGYISSEAWKNSALYEQACADVETILPEAEFYFGVYVDASETKPMIAFKLCGETTEDLMAQAEQIKEHCGAQVQMFLSDRGESTTLFKAVLQRGVEELSHLWQGVMTDFAKFTQLFVPVLIYKDGENVELISACPSRNEFQVWKDIMAVMVVSISAYGGSFKETKINYLRK